MPSSIGFAHLGRLILIAGVLRRQGHPVAFAYGGRHAGTLTDRGYPAFPVHDIPLADAPDFAGPFLERYTPSVVRRCVEDELAVIARFRPDAVVTDLRPTAAIAARRAGCPHISVMNGYLSNHFDFMAIFPLRREDSLRGWLVNRFGRRLLDARKYRLGRHLRRVARQLGVDGKTSLFDFFQGDLNLIVDLPQFSPLVERPPNYIFTGPLIWEGSKDSATVPLPPRLPGRRLIYVTLGHTGGARLLDVIMAAFGDQPAYQLVVTTGPYVDVAPYRGCPHISVHPFLPGSRVMQMSDLVIHCGGDGTTYQCLKNGLPAIVVPFNNDQRIKAHLIRRNRVGVALSIDRLSPARLLAVTRALLEDEGARRQARSLQRQLQQVDGPGTAAASILAFLEQNRFDAHAGVFATQPEAVFSG